MTAPAYFVDGVQLVNTGGELCEACEERPAVGRSIGGHAICKRCAGWASHLSDELAAEVEASRLRRQEQTEINRARISKIVSHLEHGAEGSRKRSMRCSLANRNEAASKANQRKAEHLKQIRESAVMGAMGKLPPRQTARSLALVTGLSLATVKRALHDLMKARHLLATRQHKSSTYLYSVRRAS